MIPRLSNRGGFRVRIIQLSEIQRDDQITNCLALTLLGESVQVDDNMC